MSTHTNATPAAHELFLSILHTEAAVTEICRFLDRSGTVRALSSLSRSSRDAPFVKPTIKALKETALADGVLYALRHHTSVASRICLLSGGLECLPALACVSAQMDEATHVTEFLHAIKRDEERNDWLLKSDEEKDGELFAIDCLVARALPNVVEVAELRVGNVALHFAARAALDGFVRQASSTKIAEKKDDPVKTKCGAVGRLTKTPKTGCYSIRLSADHAKGDKGKVVSFRTKEIEEKYLKPAVANIEASACCVGIIGYGHGYGLPSGARKVTVDNLLKHGEKLAEKEAEAKEKTILEVNYKFFDQGRPAFEAALRAAPTRAAELHLIRKEALLLQNMPSENITIGVQSFCLPRIEALEILAGPGYQRDSKSYKEEGPGGKESYRRTSEEDRRRARPAAPPRAAAPPRRVPPAVLLRKGGWREAGRALHAYNVVRAAAGRGTCRARLQPVLARPRQSPSFGRRGPAQGRGEPDRLVALQPAVGPDHQVRLRRRLPARPPAIPHPDRLARVQLARAARRELGARREVLAPLISDWVSF